MTLICIACRKEFETIAQAWDHSNPLIGKTTLRQPAKRHIVVEKTVAAPKPASSNG